MPNGICSAHFKSGLQLTSMASTPTPHHPPQYQGQRLRALAFALLAKREYSKHALYQKLCGYAADHDEAWQLVEELATANYQSDQRMAGMLVRQQLRLGRGPKRVQQQLQKHQIEQCLANEDLATVDWYQQALTIKIKKFGSEIATDPKQINKQIRFLQYRGYSIDVIMRVIKSENLAD